MPDGRAEANFRRTEPSPFALCCCIRLSSYPQNGVLVIFDCRWQPFEIMIHYRTTQIKRTNSLCELLYACSAILHEQEPYHRAFACAPGCFTSKRQQPGMQYFPMSNVYRMLGISSSSFFGDSECWCDISDALGLGPLIRLREKGWYFLTCSFLMTTHS